jgi:hypothetical protein
VEMGAHVMAGLLSLSRQWLTGCPLIIDYSFIDVCSETSKELDCSRLASRERAFSEVVVYTSYLILLS